MTRKAAYQIATGNSLLEGEVVYLAADGSWSPDIGDAAVATTPESADALLARALACPDEVVGVYLAECRLDERGRPQPAHFREAFRTRGPSNYPWLGKQAEKVDV
jgi:hypothetical protein